MARRAWGPEAVPQLGLPRGLGVPWWVPLPGLLGQEQGPPRAGQGWLWVQGLRGEHG